MKTKANSVVTHAVSGSVVTFTVLGVAETFSIDAATVAGEGWEFLSANGRLALIHGIVQKVSDRAAIGRDPDTGKSAAVQEKFDAMQEVATRLEAGGPWNVAREGGGNEGGLLFRAIKSLYPNAWASRKEFTATLEEKAKTETAKRGVKITVADVRKGLGDVKSVAREMQRIRESEAGNSKLNGAELLADLPVSE